MANVRVASGAPACPLMENVQGVNGGTTVSVRNVLISCSYHLH